jgi:hypothetical protein
LRGEVHQVKPNLIVRLAAIAALAMPAHAPAQEASGDPGQEVPRLDREALDRTQPGWTVLTEERSPSAGSLATERKVWPMLYLHWWPWEESMGQVISVEEAGKRVTAAWEENLSIDSPLEGRPIDLPQHPAVLFEATTSGSKWKTRYVAWYCPQSFRVFVADANLSLLLAAPDELLDLMIDIVRTVRCHTTAALAKSDLLPSRYSVPGSELSLSLPEEWRALSGYRVQPGFAGASFKSDLPASTPLRGQALFLARDAVRSLDVSWTEEEDFPMSYDVLQQKVEGYWRPRAKDMMILGSSSLGGFWRMDGVVMIDQDLPFRIPASRYRAWMWRSGETTFFVMGSLTPTRFGRQDMQYEWDPSFEAMFKNLKF